MKHRSVSWIVVTSMVLFCLVACSSPEPAQIEGPTRTIITGEREVLVPEDAQRIIALDVGTAVDMIALGVEPIGIVDYGRRDTIAFFSYPHQTIPSMGDSDGPNYEAILAQSPDLMVGRLENISWLSDAEAQLAAIAPIALSDATSAEWDEHLQFVGDAINKRAEADVLVSIFDRRLAEFREAYESTGRHETETIAIIRSRASLFNIYANNYFITQLVKDAGLNMPEGYEDLPARNRTSLEELDQLSSDYLFVVARNEDEAGALAEARDTPLWQLLPSVQKDQVYEVEFSIWVSGWNVGGANIVLDNLFEIILGQESPTPNPLAEYILDDY
ncbi:MAG: iron-siderophore ABC transporter substrate-binding protein [Chloroflexota bacterium]